MEEMLKLNEEQFAQSVQRRGYCKGKLRLKDGAELLAIGKKDEDGHLACCCLAFTNGFGVHTMYLRTGDSVTVHSVESRSGRIVIECPGVFFYASQIEDWMIDTTIGYRRIFEYDLKSVLDSEGYSMDKQTKKFKRDSIEKV